MKNQFKSLCVGLAILGLAAAFRFTGINWDQNQHLHPDERFLTMVATDIQWPHTIDKYFDTKTSLLNPHNVGYNFYVYGTWPVYLVKAVAQLFHQDTYNGIPIVGRVCSGIADLITLIFVFIIGKKITKHLYGGFFSAFVYACMALPIQSAHYFTVDPYLTLFLTLTVLFLLEKPTKKTCIGLGICFGLAVTTKISAIIITPVILLWFCVDWIKNKKYIQTILYGLLFSCISYLTIRLFLPYLFMDSIVFSFSFNEKLIDNWKQLQNFSDPNGWYPPAVQWINTKAYLFPLGNMIFVGLGLPLAILCFATLLSLYKKWSIHISWISMCILCIFGYQGIQFAKAARYFYPIYPLLAILTGYGIWHFWNAQNKQRVILIGIFLVLLIWPMMITSIYQKTTTRIAASEWIYENIPNKSTLATEHWDDGLPVSLEQKTNVRYAFVELPLFAPDTNEKWELVHNNLRLADYIILSSNRVYGSIMSAQEKYPQTAQYYQQLFDGTLGFVKVAEFTSRPSLPFPVPVCIPLPFFSYGSIAKSACTAPGIHSIDDYVDESWTVYDHPKVTIFKKL